MMRRWLLIVAVLIGGGAAHGAIPAPAELSARGSSASAPAAFAAVRRIEDDVKLHGAQRHQLAGISRRLKVMAGQGRGALAALILRNAGEAAKTPLDESARAALVGGALEALGEKPDLPAVALAHAVLSSKESSELVLGAACLVLGRHAAQDDVASLIAQVAARPLDDTSEGHRASAAIAGLGHARVGSALAYLAARIRDEDSRLQAFAEAAAFAGSSWAWEALGPARADEGRAHRAALVDSLFGAWPAATGDARAAVERALVVIDASAAAAKLATLPASPRNDSLRKRLRLVSAQQIR